MESFWNEILLHQYADKVCYTTIRPTAMIASVDTLKDIWQDENLITSYGLSREQLNQAYKYSQLCHKCDMKLGKDKYFQVCIRFHMAKVCVSFNGEKRYKYHPSIGVAARCRRCSRGAVIVVDSEILECFLVRIDLFMLFMVQTFFKIDMSGQQMLYMIKCFTEINRYPILKEMSKNKIICDCCAQIPNQILKCSACHYIAYCSSNCAKKDWKQHKNECLKIQKCKLLL